MVQESTPLAVKSGYESQKTVEELFADEDDDEENVQIVEYVDMVDEGYFAPPLWMIALLIVLLLFAATGVGVGVYFAWENHGKNKKSSSQTIVPPTSAPTASNVPTASPAGGYVCNICAAGNVTIPGGVVNIVGQPSCLQLQARGHAGELTQGQCQLVQAVTSKPCGCSSAGGGGGGANQTTGCTVCAGGGSIGNLSGIVNVSAAGVPGFNTLTCGRLDTFAKNGSIPNEFCTVLHAAAATPCQCPAVNVTNTTCTVCAQGVVTNPQGVLNVSSAGFPGIDTLTCGQADTFAKQGSIPEQYCPPLQATSVDICGCATENTTAACTVCAQGVVRNGSAILNVSSVGLPGIDTLTCGQAELFAQQGNIPQGSCSPLQAAAADVCDCGIENTTATCSVCAQGIIRNSSAILNVSSVGFPGIGTLTCGQADLFARQGNIPQASCTPLQAAAVDICDCGTENATSTTCNVCAEGAIRNLSGVLNMSFTGLNYEATCGELLAATQSGSISSALCAPLQALTANACDCGFFNATSQPPVAPCSICDSGNISNPNAQLQYQGQTLTCSSLQSLATSGQIPTQNCPTLKFFALQTCTCGSVSASDQTILNMLASVVGGNVNVPGTSEYLAAQYLLYKDPRFSQARRHRKTMALSSDDSGSGSAVSGESSSPETWRTLQTQSNSSGVVSPTKAPIPSNATGVLIPVGSNMTSNVTNSRNGTTLPPKVGNPVYITATSSQSLGQLTNAQIIQRYLLILLYFQTTNNLANPWGMECAADAAPVIQIRRQLQGSSVCNSSLTGTSSYKWLSGAFECQWDGVTCTNVTGTNVTQEVIQLNLSKFTETVCTNTARLSDAHTRSFVSHRPFHSTHLFLAGFGLMGALPTSILALPSLTIVDFSHNQFIGLIPSSYLESSGNSLEYLNLANNTLEGILPIIDVTVMKFLDVSNNFLFSDLRLNAAVALESLNISHNALTGNLSATAPATVLAVLDATSNKFAGNLSNTDALFQLLYLTTLKLGGNFFAGPFPLSMTALVNLHTLELENNNLSGSIPSQISALAALTTLNLSGNGLGGTLPSDLGLLVGLEHFSVYDNYLNGTIPSQITNLVALETANFGKNEFVGQVPSGVCSLPVLQTFAIDCANVTCSGSCCTCCTQNGCNATGAII